VAPGDIVELKYAGSGTFARKKRSTASETAGARQTFSLSVRELDCRDRAIRFGDSMWTGRPIIEEIKIRLELSLQLAVMATVVADAAGGSSGNPGGAQAGYLGRLRRANFPSPGWRCRRFGSDRDPFSASSSCF